MKKIFFTLCIVFITNQLAQAQVDFGIKGGINYNSDSFIDVKDDIVDEDAKSKTGFHAGIWSRINIPATSLYIRPELVYTALKSELSSNGDLLADYDFQKIDVPVLFGTNFLKVLHIYAGPSFQYIIDGDLKLVDVNFETAKTEVSGFTVGAQVGFGVELSNIGFDVRWERGLSDIGSSFIGNSITETSNIEFDTRVNQIIISVSLKF